VKKCLRHPKISRKTHFQVLKKWIKSSLGVVGKTGKARELVGYCQRHNLLNALVERCRILRPNINWLGSEPPPSQQQVVTTETQSGGVNITAETVNIYGDVTGRDTAIVSSGSVKSDFNE
jgi:hypothetical protein